jgi:hypothetical protein
MCQLMSKDWMRRAAASSGRALVRPFARIVALRLDAVVERANADDAARQAGRRSRVINPDNFR